jgi:hypothetical protein
MIKTPFYYRYNDVNTNKSWDNPTWDVFWLWWNEFKSNVVVLLLIQKNLPM